MAEKNARAAFWKKLEAMGEETVRVNIAAGDWGDHSAWRALADEWLRSLERARDAAADARNEALMREQADAARSAKNAAWTAAIAAIIAAIVATISTAISLFGLGAAPG